MDILSQMEKILRDKEPDADTLWPMFYGVRGSYDGYLLQDLSVSKITFIVVKTSTK